MSIQNFVQTIAPERYVVLSLEELKKLKGYIEELMDGVSNLPMSMHYFHIGESGYKLNNCGFDNKDARSYLEIKNDRKASLSYGKSNS